MKSKKLNLSIQSIHILDLESKSALLGGKRVSRRRKVCRTSREAEVAGEGDQ